MIDIQTVACFNTCSPLLHLFLSIQCQIHNIIDIKIHKILCKSMNKKAMGLYAELLHCLWMTCTPADDMWMSSTCDVDDMWMMSSTHAHGADDVQMMCR